MEEVEAVMDSGVVAGLEGGSPIWNGSSPAVAGAVRRASMVAMSMIPSSEQYQQAACCTDPFRNTGRVKMHNGVMLATERWCPIKLQFLHVVVLATPGNLELLWLLVPILAQAELSCVMPEY